MKVLRMCVVKQDSKSTSGVAIQSRRTASPTKEVLLIDTSGPSGMLNGVHQ